MSIERLTHDGKVNGSTSISPDGRYVVYEVSKDGKRSLWLRQIATSSAVKLVPDTDNGFGGTAFSPDGNFVYYQQNSNEEPNGALYKVPTLGRFAAEDTFENQQPNHLFSRRKAVCLCPREFARGPDFAACGGQRRRQ